MREVMQNDCLMLLLTAGGILWLFFVTLIFAQKLLGPAWSLFGSAC